MRERCYRYTATPTPVRQSYFVNPPIKSDGTCGYFSEENAVTKRGIANE